MWRIASIKSPAAEVLPRRLEIYLYPICLEQMVITEFYIVKLLFSMGESMLNLCYATHWYEILNRQELNYSCRTYWWGPNTPKCPVPICNADVIKWKHFPRYWPFVRGIHRSPVNSQHKGQWRGALMFSLICAWMNNCVSNHEAGDLRRHRAHYDVTVMLGTYNRS